MMRPNAASASTSDIGLALNESERSGTLKRHISVAVIPLKTPSPPPILG